jgi:hypothetical protein
MILLRFLLCNESSYLFVRQDISILKARREWK